MKTIDEIVAIKEAAEKKILSMKGVTGIDVGYKYVDGKRTDEISIRVHVAKKQKGVPKAEAIPAEIDGVKTDVLENTFVPQYLKVKVEDIAAFADVSSYNPLQGGISIGPDRAVGGYVFAGTLGAPVVDAATNQTVLLSNFHVMCIDANWHVGDVMDQPSRVDGGSIANRVATLNRSTLSAHVDGALASLDAGKTTIAQIVGLGNIRGTGTVALNAPVRKRGRTTLLTYGFVDAISASVTIDYGSTIGSRTLTNQIGVRPDTTHNPMFSDHGDSGSIVIDANNQAVGLLFAGNTSGYTYMNPIASVMSELNVRIGTGAIKTTPNTYYYEWRGNGVQTINISIPDVHSYSNVMVAISEFSANSRADRFMGAAKMRAFNVSPYEGGVIVWTEVTWSSPINVVLDLLVN